MQRALRILPITLALAVSLAPAALAKQHAGGGGGATAQSQMSGMQHMLPGGISFKGQMDHAYTEAIKAHESVVLGMNDMATNHLSNVDLVLSHLEDQMGGGGGAQGQQMLNQQMRTQFSAIRKEASNLRGNMGDRANAMKGTTQLVSRFVTFYDTMGTTTMGGGGGAAAMPMKSPVELVGGAGSMVAETQAALAGRDFDAAALHAKDAVNHLQKAEQVATRHKLPNAEITRIRTLRQEATKLNTAVTSRSANATKQAGKLVTRIGTELPRLAEATMGGGAGMPRD